MALDDAVGVATQDRQVTEPVALLSPEEPVDDLPRTSGAQEAGFGGRVQEPDEPYDGVQQARVQRAHVDGLHAGIAPRLRMTGLDHDRADEGRVELQAEAQVRPLLRRLGDLAHDGQLDGGDEVMGRVVPVAVVAQQDLLAALRDHAEGGLGDAVHRLRGRGRAIEAQPFERLYGPVFADRPRDALDQLFAVVLHACAPHAPRSGDPSNP